MNGFRKKILTLLVFVAAFFMVRYGMDLYHEHTTVAKIEQLMENIKKEGVQKHADAPVSEAMHKEAVEQTSVKLKSEPDKRKRLETAAGNFFGFFLVNTRERAEFCREQGVDIAMFVSAFERGHTTELANARSALSNSSVSEDKLYAMLKPQLRKVIEQDMRDIASANKISLREACELISKEGTKLATEMHISKVQPDVYRVLAGSP